MSGSFGSSFSGSSFSVESSFLAPTAITDPIAAIGYSPLDHTEDALARLPHSYRQRCDGPGETNTQKLLRVWMTPAADLELALLSVLAGLNVETASGFMLTILGKWVGRTGRVADDEIERRYVRATIAANKSDGTIDDILSVAGLVLGDSAATLALDNTGAAAYVLRVESGILDDDIAVVLVQLVLKATSCGVRAIVEWSSVSPAETFTFDAGPGFDVGHLVTGADHS